MYVCIHIPKSVYLSSQDYFNTSLHLMLVTVFPGVCLSVFLSVCLSVCLSVFLSVCLSVCLSVFLSFCLSVCAHVMYVCMYVYMYVRVYVYVYVYVPLVRNECDQRNHYVFVDVKLLHGARDR